MPINTPPEAITGALIPRNVNAGTSCSTFHNSSPVSEFKAFKIPEDVLTITTPESTAGVLITSPLILASHNTLPVSASKAYTLPFSLPIKILSKPAAGPPESSAGTLLSQKLRSLLISLKSVSQSSLPVLGSKAITSPSRLAL